MGDVGDSDIPPAYRRIPLGHTPLLSQHPFQKGMAGAVENWEVKGEK